MKVNITGKGIIPGIGTLAPKYNIELDRDAIKRILEFPHYHQLVITDVDTNLVITSKNLDTFFDKKVKKEFKFPQPVQASPKVKPVVIHEQPIIETSTVVEEMPPEITKPEVVVEVTSTSEKIGNVREVEPEVYETPEITIEPSEDDNAEKSIENTFKKKKKYHK